MSRYTSRSEVDIDRYDDRRSRGGRNYDERETDITFRRGAAVKERDRESVATPAFLRDDYGQTTAGPMVLRARDREDVTYAPSRRHRSVSPQRKEREEIIIRGERSESRPAAPRRAREEDREEIIIRREEREHSRPAPRRRRAESVDREEIIIRRDERSDSRPPARRREASREREEIIIRRDEKESTPARRAPREERERDEVIIRREERERYEPPPPARTETDRQEIIIRRDKVEDEPPRRRREDDLALSRPKSHERARGRSYSSASEEEIIIRRDQREGRRGEETRQEIIIRKTSRSRSRSPSPAFSVSTRPPPVELPPRPVVYAPEIHQEVITHHRHVDHGYEVRAPQYREPVRERTPVYSRQPSLSPPPPAPMPPREESEERIEIRRTETRNGRSENQEIVVSRRDRSQSAPPARRERESLELDIYREREVEPAPTIGARWGARHDPRDRLWTEVTKDLVVKEAIREMGYEFEETDDYYYIFKYMEYVSSLCRVEEDVLTLTG